MPPKNRKQPESTRKPKFFRFKAGFELPRPNPVEPCCRFADSIIFQNPTFLWPGLAKSDKIPAMPGSRSRHIGQLRANPFEECCRTRRVNAEGLILASIGGRKDQNHHAPLRKPYKTGKIQKGEPRPGQIWATFRGKPSPKSGPGKKRPSGPNGPWAQMGPGPKRALAQIG